ncbi:unnamed protein product [Sphagnum troendelagicum]|uniref:Carbohydrate kinase PfkB domain-containing protein n=1 Tax=Sphagnum troendelagicum TaxID=128251 RepID=A0ABP0U927_9BRYO
MQVGKDGHASLKRDALASAGVHLDHMNTMKRAKNSIILVQGAIVSWPHLADGIRRLVTIVQQLICWAGAVLLQQEIPDNLSTWMLLRMCLQIVGSANLPVTLDAGGTGIPVPQELLKCVTILTPNESEVAQFTGMPTNTWEQTIKATAKIQILVLQDGPPLIQRAIQPPVVVDATVLVTALCLHML